MPFALIITGLVLLVAGVKGTQNQLYSLIQGDFTGPNNFIFWMLSILIIGGLGYVPKLQPISRMFLFLIIVVLFLNKGGTASKPGFFSAFQSAISAA